MRIGRNREQKHWHRQKMLQIERKITKKQGNTWNCKEKEHTSIGNDKKLYQNEKEITKKPRKTHANCKKKNQKHGH